MPSPSSATIGQGTGLKREVTPGSGTYEQISEIMDITGPTEQTALTEVTNHDSAGHVREWILGLIDPGTLSFKGNLLPHDSTQDGITGFYFSFHARNRDNYQVVPAPQGTLGIYQLLGLPTKHSKSFPSDGKQSQWDGEIKITSPVVYTP